MLSDANASIAGALIGGVFGLAGVWVGFSLARRASEKDRRAQKLLTIYIEVERLANVLRAYQTHKLTPPAFASRWYETTEKIMGALIGSKLDKKRVLKAINSKWNDPKAVTVLRDLADELLKIVDPDYAGAAADMLAELGLTRDDIEPTLIQRK
jgi:hypothetical protein